MECNAPNLADLIENKEDRDDARGHAVAREAVSKTKPLSSQEAFELVDEIASLAGVDSKTLGSALVTPCRLGCASLDGRAMPF